MCELTGCSWSRRLQHLSTHDSSEAGPSPASVGKCLYVNVICSVVNLSQVISVERHARVTVTPQLSNPNLVRSIPHPSPGVTLDDFSELADHIFPLVRCLFSTLQELLQICGVPKAPKLRPMYTPDFGNSSPTSRVLQAGANGRSRGSGYLRFFFTAWPFLFPFLTSCCTSAKSSATALGRP